MPQATTWGMHTEPPAPPTAVAIRINESFDALLSMHSGTSAPAYALKGTWWLDTSATPHPIKIYDGASWVQVATMDPSAHTITWSAPTIAIADVTGLQDALDAKVPTSRTVSAGGLLTGGGALSGNVTITGTGASQAEAEAGINNAVLMTPLRTSQSIAALAQSAITITSQAAAEAGTDNVDFMTALRTAQAIAALAPGGKNATMQVFTAGGTWTKPANCTKALVLVTGSGGGGGGSDNATGVAACGGAGGTAIWFGDVSAISSRTVTIGTAGAAGSSSGGDGGDGGASSWGTEAAANGGIGGDGCSAAGSAIDGGIGGAATAGTIQINGGDGSNGLWIASTVSHVVGQGGASLWGGGGRTRGDPLVADTGRAGQAYGSGGGGGMSNSATGRSGGAGKAGICVVIELYGTN